jgi:hypothetical protein
LCSQKKETKEKATPLPLHPSVLAPHLGGCGTRYAQTVLAAFHLLAQAEGAAQGIESQNPLFAAVASFLASLSTSTPSFPRRRESILGCV